jgi:hypothetical protein
MNNDGIIKYNRAINQQHNAEDHANHAIQPKKTSAS